MFFFDHLLTMHLFYDLILNFIVYTFIISSQHHIFYHYTFYIITMNVSGEIVQMVGSCLCKSITRGAPQIKIPKEYIYTIG